MARPRSVAARQAAIDATVALLLDSGVDGVTLEEVAARSGVAKSTLYRHFGTKEELVATAAQECVVALPTPDTGNLEQDLLAIFGHYQRSEDEAQVHRLFPVLLDAGMRDPHMRVVLERLIEERSRPIRTVLRLAAARGEVSPDLDLDVAVATIVGPLTYRRLVERREVTPEFKEQVLRNAVAALRATAAAPPARRRASSAG
ncbi:MAG: TetR/AcrR family transcriptional regulator [Acidimicrobiales bacterium]